MLLDYLLDKASEKLENVYRKYQSTSVSKEITVKNSSQISLNCSNLILIKTLVKTGFTFLIPQLINKLLKWIKEQIEKFVKKLLSSFNKIFEEIGEKIIIIQEKTGNIINKILEKVESVSNLIGNIKDIITKIIEVIQSKNDIKSVIIKLVDISDFMLENGIKNLTEPINNCINAIKSGIKKTVNDEYNNIKNTGITFYEEKKNNFNTGYNTIKNKVVNLPDNLAKILNEKKIEFQKEFNKSKELIIKKTDIKLKNVIDTQQIEKSFYNIINKIKSNIEREIKLIKEEIKNNICDFNEFLIELYDDIIDFINDLMKYNISEYVDDKFIALEETVIFILDIITEKYETDNLNENNLLELLICHFEKKINDYQRLCHFLIGNKLFFLIEKIRVYTKEKIFSVQSFYNSILNATKMYLNLLLKSARNYISESLKCLDAFDYFIQYIDKIYKNCCLYELYFIDRLKSINSFIEDISEKINDEKNKEINKLEDILNQKIEKEYNKLMQMNNVVTNKINSTFNNFENKIIKPVDNTICETASEIENKLFDVANNLERKAENCLQKIDPNDIGSKMFYRIKQKKDKLINKLDNEKFNEVNNRLNRFCNSNFINKSKNSIDNIDSDLQKANSIINNISKIHDSFKINNKIEFRNYINDKIREKIISLYTIKIEPELKHFLEKACNKLINKIVK